VSQRVSESALRGNNTWLDSAKFGQAPCFRIISGNALGLRQKSVSGLFCRNGPPSALHKRDLTLISARLLSMRCWFLLFQHVSGVFQHVSGVLLSALLRTVLPEIDVTTISNGAGLTRRLVQAIRRDGRFLWHDAAPEKRCDDKSGSTTTLGLPFRPLCHALTGTLSPTFGWVHKNVPDRSRTCNLRLRRATLYPIELPRLVIKTLGF